MAAAVYDVRAAAAELALSGSPCRRHGRHVKALGFDALQEAGFRTGDHGLVEWSVAGERYVKQALPPWTVDFSYPPESLVAEMDYVGIERALIHRTPYMTDSNTWIGACVRRFPDRLDGLAHIPEWRIEGEMDAMIAELYRAINTDGLVGLQFDVPRRVWSPRMRETAPQDGIRQSMSNPPQMSDQSTPPVTSARHMVTCGGSRVTEYSLAPGRMWKRSLM